MEEIQCSKTHEDKSITFSFVTGLLNMFAHLHLSLSDNYLETPESIWAMDAEEKSHYVYTSLPSFLPIQPAKAYEDESVILSRPH